MLPPSSRTSLDCVWAPESHVSHFMSAEGDAGCLIGNKEFNISIHTFCVTLTVFPVRCLVPVIYLRVFLEEKRWVTPPGMPWISSNFTETGILTVAPPRYFSPALLAAWQTPSAEKYCFKKGNLERERQQPSWLKRLAWITRGFSEPLMGVYTTYKHKEMDLACSVDMRSPWGASLEGVKIQKYMKSLHKVHFFFFPYTSVIHEEGQKFGKIK